MPKFLVRTTEVYVTEFEIEADDEEAACAIADERCINEEWDGSTQAGCERDSEATPL